MPFLTLKRISPFVAAWLCLVACDGPQPSPTAASPAEDNRSAPRANVSEQTQRQMAFLNRIRQPDAFNTSIARTLLNDQNELGIVLSSSMTPDKVPALMRQVMTQMAQEFPREDLTLDAYLSATPPHKIGTAHLDGQTGNTTYTPEK